MSFHPDLMHPAYPALAQYLDKYLGPAKYHLALADRDGAPLLDIDGRDRAETVRYRLLQRTAETMGRQSRAQRRCLAQSEVLHGGLS